MIQDFQQEAMNKLSITAPSLMGGVLRFQDLSQGFTQVKNVFVGVFVLALPAGAFLIPVVARDDIVFPLDSVYDTTEDKFKPLTPSYIQVITTMQGTRMGTPQRIPSYVNVNPSIYNMIVPPRTGKYAYASAGLEDFLAQVPQGLFDRFRATLMENKGITARMNEVIDLTSALDRPLPRVNRLMTEVSEPGVQILTSANDINPAEISVIKDILDCGYHIKGDIQEPRPAVEMVSGHEGLIQVDGAVEGMAYRALRLDGSSVNTMILKRAPRIYGIDLPMRKTSLRGGFMTGDGKAEKADDGKYLLITEYGGWCPDGDVVLHAQPIELSDVAKEMYAQGKVRDMQSVCNGDTFVMLTHKGALGPFTARSVTHTDSMIIIRACQPYGSSHYSSMMQNGEVVITVSTGYSGDYFAEPGRILTSPHRSAIILGHREDEALEHSLSSARNRMELRVRGELCDPLDISSHGHGFFSMGGRQLSEPELAELLIVGHGLGKQASIGFIKSAKEKGKITVMMQKKASIGEQALKDAMTSLKMEAAKHPVGSVAHKQTMLTYHAKGLELGRLTGTVPQSTTYVDYMKSKGMMTEEGAKSHRAIVDAVMQKKAVDMGATPVGEIPEYGQVPPQEELTNFNLNALSDAVNTQYPDIVEGAIMIQFLQDPSMYSTIGGYLPLMKDCVDRIGRTLLLLRLHSDTLAPDQTSGVAMALRNTYNQVGDSVLKLEQMVNSYISDGIPSQNRI